MTAPPVRFSLVMPAHDEERFIHRSLESVLGQDGGPIEVLVVCDRCTDGTAQACRSLGIEPIVVDVGHPGLARNVALDRARGEYVLFLDADDYFLRSDAVRLIDEALSSAADPDVLHYSFLWGRDLVPPLAWYGRMYGMVWARAWKRTAIGAVRFPQSRFGEDYRFCLDVYRQSVSHAVLETPLVQYTYPRADSLTGRWVRRSRAQRQGLWVADDASWRPDEFVVE